MLTNEDIDRRIIEINKDKIEISKKIDEYQFTDRIQMRNYKKLYLKLYKLSTNLNNLKSLNSKETLQDKLKSIPTFSFSYTSLSNDLYNFYWKCVDESSDIINLI